VAIGYQYSRSIPTSSYRARLDEARRAISAAVEKDPGLPLGHFLLGRAWEMLGDPDAAEAELRDAAAKDPESGLIRYHLGRLLMHRTALMILDEIARWTSSNNDAQEIFHLRLDDQGKNGPATERQAAEAGAEIEKATKLQTGLEDDMQADLAAVMLAFTRKKWDDVRRLCGDAPKKFAGRPGLEEFYWWQALAPARGRDAVVFQAKREPGQTYGFQIVLAVANGDVEKLLDRALDAHPRFPLGLYARALFRIQKGTFVEARQDLDAALELSPKLTAAYVARAVTRDRKKDADAAAADLDRALALARQPADRRDAHLLRFAMRRDRGDERGAQDDLNRCVEADPSDWLSRYTRGEERVRLADHAGALEDFNACLKLQPRFTHARERRGYVYACQGKSELALKDYNDALRANPNSLCVPMNLAYRAEVFMAMGKLEESEADLADLFGRETIPVVHTYGLRVRAVLYTKTRRYDEALVDLETYIGRVQEKSDLGWAYHARGVCLALKNRPDEALQSVNRSIELRPNHPEPYFLRAKLREMNGDDAGAIQDARKSLQLHAKEPQRADLLKLLKDKNAKP